MFLGIEIGGTKLQLGLGAGDGILRGLWRGPVDVEAGADGIRKQILAAVPELFTRSGIFRSQVRAIGVGFGGPVDEITSTVIKSHQIAGWDSFSLPEWITELLGWQVALGNDADVAGLAEALFGAGKGFSPIFYITIGSGIGGGLIIDGEIYRGCGRGAAEIGHLRLPEQSLSGLERTIVEEIASGWGIEREAQRQAALRGEDDASLHLVKSLAGNSRSLKAEQLAEAALKGDPFAWDILNPAWDCLAEAICHVIALLCPRRIVIGGGVSLMGEEVLFAPLRKKVAQRVFKPFLGCYDIVPATLGEAVVVHGALALARKRFSP